MRKNRKEGASPETDELLFATMHLDLNGATSCRVYRNESMILAVNMSGYQPHLVTERKLEAERQRELLRESLDAGKIRRDEYDRRLRRLKATEISVPVMSIGTKRGPWWTHVRFYQMTDGPKPLGWPIHLLVAYPREEEAELEGGRTYLAEFGVDPRDVSKIPAGTYRVRASAEMKAKTGASQKTTMVESNEVTVELLSEDMPREEASRPERKSQLASYYLRRGRYDEAQILVKDLGTIKGYLIMGELHEIKGNYQEAYDYYTKAEEEFHRRHPDSYEGPEIVASKIVNLLRKWKPEGESQKK